MSLNTFLLKNKQHSFINYIYICFAGDIIQLLHGFIILAKIDKELQLTLQLPLSKYFAGFIGFWKISTEKFLKTFPLLFFHVHAKQRAKTCIWRHRVFLFIKIFLCTPLEIVLIFRKVLPYQMLLCRMIYQMLIGYFMILRR